MPAADFNPLQKSTGARASRFAGLDAIRFVCAYLVVSGHSPSSLSFLRNWGPTAEVIGKVLRDLVNGPAAVIVFFVISGFCIHWPYRAGQRIGADYFARRYLRIGVPLGAALLLSPHLGISAGDLVESVLWSLYCELIYYTIYPLLSQVARRVGWREVVAPAFLLALLWAIVSPSPSGNYSTGSVLRDCVFGLPCWLMGCLLAERQANRPPTTGNIWLWRGAVFAASVATLELRFHTPVHFDVSLNFFGILVFYWLSRELDHCKKSPPWSWLERAGVWSYSLYVMHPAANQVTDKIFSGWSLEAQWLIRMPMTLAICYLFYLLVEEPSHRLARVVGNVLRPRVVTGAPPLA